MIKNRKQMFIVIGVFCLVLLLGTVTYAFFNYTRTGSSNVIKVGKMTFNSEQGTAINLTNMFPIDPTETGVMNDNTKVGSVTVHITGDTTYDEGIEYVVTAVNVNNSVGTGENIKSVPISVQVEASNGLGTADADYFTNRGGNSSIYRLVSGNVIQNNVKILVGYITKGATGIDGSPTNPYIVN